METPKTSYARSGELHVAYQAIGDGPIDVVLVPNWITHVEAMWEIPSIARALERLAAFARTIVYDHRGTGLSDPVPLDAMPTLEARMEDMFAVMDDAGVERAALIGYSSAGPLASLFAATHPHRTSALVLANSYARLVAAPDFAIGLPVDEVTALFEAAVHAWGRAEPVAGWNERDDARTLEMWARYQRQAASPGTAAAMVRMVVQNDIRRVLGDIRVPTLVLSHAGPGFLGTRRHDHARYLADQIPYAKMVDVAGNEPADLTVFIDEIRGFLTGVPDAPDPDRVLATVLFSDIVGSTERAVSLGDREWRALLDRHDEMVRRQLDRFRGREIRSLGDGFLATFDGPARAIRCAQAIRDGAERLDIDVRIGLHTGEVETRGDDVGGIAVHIAERVSAHAGASEVLVSRTVTDLVAGSGIRFSERGETELKGVPGTWQLFAVDS